MVYEGHQFVVWKSGGKHIIDRGSIDAVAYTGQFRSSGLEGDEDFLQDVCVQVSTGSLGERTLVDTLEWRRASGVVEILAVVWTGVGTDFFTAVRVSKSVVFPPSESGFAVSSHRASGATEIVDEI